MVLAQGAAHANNVNTKFDKLLESGRLRLKAGLIEFELHYSGDSCTIECTLNDHEDMKRWFEDAEDRRGPWRARRLASDDCWIIVQAWPGRARTEDFRWPRSLWTKGSSTIGELVDQVVGMRKLGLEASLDFPTSVWERGADLRSSKVSDGRADPD